MKVLIVDDNEQNLYLLKTLLNKNNYECVSAKNGVEALKKLKQDAYDMIITDILMPRMDGFQLCRECKTDDNLKAIPLIFYTATYTDKKDEEFALSLGAEKFINKPMEAELFMNIIQDTLKDYKQGLGGSSKFASAEIEETVYLKAYSQRLINKLEDKVLELEKDVNAREKAEKSVIEQKEFLSNILESITQPLYVIDVGDYTVKMANSAAGGDLLSKDSKCYTVSHGKNKPCQDENYPCPIEKIKKDKKPVVVEHLHRDKESVDKIVEIRAYPLFDSQGNVSKVLEYTCDITERKKAEKEIEAYKDHLEALVQERTADLEAFCYSISHDLKAPLRAIEVFTKDVLKDCAGKKHINEETKEMLERIKINSKNMNTLIDNLLKMAYLQQKDICVLAVDMYKIANEVIQELKSPDIRGNIHFSVKALPSVNGDEVLLKQVLVNYISNAIKYTQDCDIAEIEIGGEQREREVVYYVKDTGVGFDMRYVDKLFHIFQRVHSSEEFAGTGIGLALVKRIIAKHGGRVWAEGKVGKGATFCFSLPKYK